MRVSDQGVVAYDTAKLDEGTRTAYRHDPDLKESVRFWQDRIDRLVEDVTDADKGVKIAFKAVVDSDLYEISLTGTKTPDGKTQIGVLTSKSVSSSGFDLGFSGTVGTFKSNADDIGQLEGKGWDKTGSLKAGIGLYGGHQTAIGTTNSEGDGVNNVSYGLGLGLGAEINGGYSEAKTLWHTEIESGKK